MTSAAVATPRRTAGRSAPGSSPAGGATSTPSRGSTSRPTRRPGHDQRQLGEGSGDEQRGHGRRDATSWRGRSGASARAIDQTA